MCMGLVYRYVVRSVRKAQRVQHLCFNLRTPGGVRLDEDDDYLLNISFNSRTPGGVRHVRI